MSRLGHTIELIEIATRGDVEQVVAVEEIGTRGVFTKEIQRALLAGDVDLAVHSLKDYRRSKWKASYWPPCRCERARLMYWL